MVARRADGGGKPATYLVPSRDGDDLRRDNSLPGRHGFRRPHRVFSNRLLLWAIAFELAFAVAVIYLPPLQVVFHTNALGPRELVTCFFPSPGVG